MRGQTGVREALRLLKLQWPNAYPTASNVRVACIRLQPPNRAERKWDSPWPSHDHGAIKETSSAGLFLAAPPPMLTRTLPDGTITLSRRSTVRSVCGRRSVLGRTTTLARSAGLRECARLKEERRLEAELGGNPCYNFWAISGKSSNLAPLQKLAAATPSWASMTRLPRMRSTVSLELATELPPFTLVRRHTAEYSISSASTSPEPAGDLGGAICACRILDASGK